MDTDAEIMEQTPIPYYLVRITAQAGEAMDKKYINLPALRRRKEAQQPRTVHRATAPYIVGETSNFKAMLFCIVIQAMSLCRQHFRTIWTVVSYASINPSPFLFHYISSTQKSFIFQTIST